MATADLITSFLSNEMSPDQERKFLVSVASSDSLRLELKSHVMLDRIVTEHVQRVQVPDAVRTTILTAAAAAVANAPTTASPIRGDAATPHSAARRGIFSRLTGSVAALIIGIAGFAAGYVSGGLTGGGAESAVSSESAVEKGAPRGSMIDASDDGTGVLTAPSSLVPAPGEPDRTGQSPAGDARRSATAAQTVHSQRAASSHSRATTNPPASTAVSTMNSGAKPTTLPTAGDPSATGRQDPATVTVESPARPTEPARGASVKATIGKSSERNGGGEQEIEKNRGEGSGMP